WVHVCARGGERMGFYIGVPAATGRERDIPPTPPGQARSFPLAASGYIGPLFLHFDIGNSESIAVVLSTEPQSRMTG
ncbi:MAG: hypothetical protein SVV80_12215, partial [Planctomycetota bacterium]|nr:hypothetical protein [Planctomycetota bacterium]